MTFRHRCLFAPALISATLALCGAGPAVSDGQAAPAPPAAADPAAPRYGAWGFDTAGMDRTVPPGDDFFRYADGSFVAAMKIPDDRAAWGMFNILADLSQRRVHDLLEAAARTDDATDDRPSDRIDAGGASRQAADTQRAATLYAAFMDQRAVDARSATPLAADLAMVKAAQTPAAFATLFGQGTTRLLPTLFALTIAPDARHPERYAIVLRQPELGLPDRSYYQRPQFTAQLAAYRAYVTRLLTLAGWPDADAATGRVLDFETRLAASNWDQADERDPVRTYNPVTFASLAAMAPGFDWSAYFTAAGLPRGAPIVVAEPSALVAAAALVGRTDARTLRDWAAFRLIDDAADVLAQPFVDAHFDLHDHAVNGQPAPAPRWKRAITLLDGTLGEAVGRLYVAQYFPARSRQRMQAMTMQLKAAFRRRLLANDWMSPVTRRAAVHKLDSFTIEVGFPRTWRSYDGLVVTRDDLYGDVERAGAFGWRFWLAHLGRPVDRGLWEMTPQTVNAYNEPLFNEVVFPAAILQPPFFDPNADPAINYGAIGAVIGHEMTHGFDDEGRKFDARGQLADWWTPTDAARFEALAARLGAQFEAMRTPYPGLHIDGKLTMGENIADLGGLTLALDAYHASLDGRPAPVVGGFTGDQRVFLAWAQVWRQKQRDDAARRRLVTDPHAPAFARVDGPAHNLDAWYAAFGVTPGDRLYLDPQQRVRIW